MKGIDTKLDMGKDAPVCFPSEQHCKTLHEYHALLWNKPLPNGKIFNIEVCSAIYKDEHGKDKPPSYLLKAGKFMLSSDVLSTGWNNEWGLSGGDYRCLERARGELNDAEKKHLKEIIRTIGNYIIFPKGSREKDGINQARGKHKSIRDRFDLTLECIRLWYNGIRDDKKNPLASACEYSKDFLELFGTDSCAFKKYVQFFLLDDIVNSEYNKVIPFHPSEEEIDFRKPPLPSDIVGFCKLMNSVGCFILKRNKRIDEYNSVKPLSQCRP
jgi:hypothetical protein